MFGPGVPSSTSRLFAPPKCTRSLTVGPSLISSEVSPPSRHHAGDRSFTVVRASLARIYSRRRLTPGAEPYRVVSNSLPRWVMTSRSPDTNARGWDRPTVTVGRPASSSTLVGALRSTTGIVIALYLVTLGVLVAAPGRLPDYTYNWEHYTAHGLYRFYDGARPLTDTFHVTDGLMTDSGAVSYTHLTLPTKRIV